MWNPVNAAMNFDIPEELNTYLQSIDSFIESKIFTLQHTDGNHRFFDHRREHARTNWDQDGNPRPEWEELLSELLDPFPMEWDVLTGLKKTPGG